MSCLGGRYRDPCGGRSQFDFVRRRRSVDFREMWGDLVKMRVVLVSLLKFDSDSTDFQLVLKLELRSLLTLWVRSCWFLAIEKSPRICRMLCCCWWICLPSLSYTKFDCIRSCQTWEHLYFLSHTVNLNRLTPAALTRPGWSTVHHHKQNRRCNPWCSLRVLYEFQSCCTPT